MKMHECLHNYGRIIVEAVTDEELKDISLAIKYNDHGDEFLYVRTYSGEEYQYGYWLNRPLGKYGNYIRRPVLFKSVDERCTISNEVFRILHDDDQGIQTWMGIGSAGKFNNAQQRFDTVMMRIAFCMEDHKYVMYDFNHYREDIVYFLKLNDISTEENLKKVEAITWDSRIGSVDGIAGKKKANNYLYGDKVTDVLYRGREFDVKKLKYSVASRDEFGCNTYVLNTKQLA